MSAIGFQVIADYDVFRKGDVVLFTKTARSFRARMRQCPEVPTRYPVFSPFSNHRVTVSLEWLQIRAISEAVNGFLAIFVFFM
jgi:hypothetical protein